MITGVILAGGENRRMDGLNKALLCIEKETLIERQARVMKSLCDEIIVVTNEPSELLPILGNSVRMITDYYPNKGPLGGMHAALSLARHPILWMVACDMPFISVSAAQAMLDQLNDLQYKAVIPCIQGTYHPLFGVYRQSVVQNITSMMGQDDVSVLGLLEQIAYAVVDEFFFQERGMDLKFLMNLKTPSLYKQALGMLAKSDHTEGSTDVNST